MTTPADDFDELRRLKLEAKKAHDLATAAKQAAKEYEDTLWQKYSDQNTFGLRSGQARYELKKTAYGTITDYDEFKSWVEEQGLAEEFLKTTEESARLNELVRERLETSQELPPGVGWYERRYVSVTGTKENE